MTDGQAIIELRRQIREQLSRCRQGETPNLCREAGTTEGYRKVEALAIGIVAREGVSVTTALANIEMELL